MRSGIVEFRNNRNFLTAEFWEEFFDGTLMKKMHLMHLMHQMHLIGIHLVPNLMRKKLQLAPESLIVIKMPKLQLAARRRPKIRKIRRLSLGASICTQQQLLAWTTLLGSI